MCEGHPLPEERREEQIRKANESELVRATHRLESADGATIRHSEKARKARGAHQLERAEEGTDQDSKTKRVDVHSPPRECREGDGSGQQKSAPARALTS